MRSELPKPLHQACGRSLLGWVVAALDPQRCDTVVTVVGHRSELVVDSLTAEFPDREFEFAEQLTQRGTGDAAAVGLAHLDLVAPSFSDDDHVIVLPGDTPLLRSSTLAALMDQHLSSGAAATVVSTRVEDPSGYGRIIRQGDAVIGIVEDRDASQEQKRLDEINAAIYCFRRSLLAPALRMISTDNAQGELYLTDVIEVLVDAGHSVLPFGADPVEVSGVNDRAQLGAATEAIRGRILDAWMRAGVTIVQPGTTVIDVGVQIEPDVLVQPGSVLEGSTTVGAGAQIGPFAHLHNATVGAGARIANAVVEDAHVDDGQIVAPFTQVIGRGSPSTG